MDAFDFLYILFYLFDARVLHVRDRGRLLGEVSEVLVMLEGMAGK